MVGEEGIEPPIFTAAGFDLQSNVTEPTVASHPFFNFNHHIFYNEKDYKTKKELNFHSIP